MRILSHLRLLKKKLTKADKETVETNKLVKASLNSIVNEMARMIQAGEDLRKIVQNQGRLSGLQSAGADDLENQDISMINAIIISRIYVITVML